MDDAESHALHNRVLAGDRTVSAELWERCHDELLDELHRRFPHLDPANISDAITDVILDYVERPQQYQPTKLPLDRYLRMAANGDLLNLLDKRERQPILVSIGRVAEEADDGNTTHAAEERLIRRDARLPKGMTWEKFMETLRHALPDRRDVEVIEMVAEGVRDTAAFAQLFGWDDLDIAEQRRKVKRAKDRIRLRLKRAGLGNDA